MSKYKFYFNTYFRDDSGYSYVTSPNSRITVISDNKEDATKEVFRVFKDEKYKYGWSLRASLEKVEALETESANV